MYSLHLQKRGDCARMKVTGGHSQNSAYHTLAEEILPMSDSFSPSMGFLSVCDASDPSFQLPGDENFFSCVNLSLSMILPSWCSCYVFQTCYTSPHICVSHFLRIYLLVSISLIGYTSFIELWLIHCLLRL